MNDHSIYLKVSGVYVHENTRPWGQFSLVRRHHRQGGGLARHAPPLHLIRLTRFYRVFYQYFVYSLCIGYTLVRIFWFVLVVIEFA